MWRLFGFGKSKNKSRKRLWEHLGGFSPVGRDLRRVPSWIQKFAKENTPGGGDENPYFIVKGKTFEYRVSYSGQGQNYCSIERRKRGY